MIFFFFGPAERVVHVPDELDLGVVRFRSGRAEEHLRDRHRRDLLELLGELDRRIVAAPAEQVRVGQLAHLRGRGLHQLLVAVAERRAPQPRHAFEIGLAVGVDRPSSPGRAPGSADRPAAASPGWCSGAARSRCRGPRDWTRWAWIMFPTRTTIVGACPGRVKQRRTGHLTGTSGLYLQWSAIGWPAAATDRPDTKSV